MEVRREVLGDEHVDRATANATDLTREFQELITEYAWGTIWTRPGLDRRSRSMITLTALVARGHDEELALHLRAAITNGLTVDEIKEVLLQTAIYCGVPGGQHGVPDRPAGARGARRPMADAFLYAAARTPFGRFGGALAEVRPDDLAADGGDRACWPRRRRSTRPRSATWSGAAPTRPARTTATSAGWRCCWPGCRSRCRR